MMKLSVLAIFATFSNGFVPRAFMMRKKTHLRVEELDGNPEYKKVFVAGGTKGVGRCIVDILSKDGVEVLALARTDEAVEELSALPGVKGIKGDAFDYKSVEDNMWGCDACITTLGGMTGEKRVDYEGNNNVIEAAGILGVTRVVLVTSIGCGDSKDAAPPAVFEALKDVLKDKEKAERVLQRYYTNMNWTIIRPGGLKTEPTTGKAVITADNTAIGSIHREDVAKLTVEALKSFKTKKKVLSVLDPSIGGNAGGGGTENVEEFSLA